MPSIINRLRGFDAKHYAQTERYAKQVERLLQTAAKELADKAQGASYDPNTVFSFNDLPQTRRQAQGILTRLVSRIQHVVESGSASEWLAATYKNDAFLGDILRTSRLTKEEAEQYQARNLDALATFQRRKVGGLRLSQNVWKYAGDFVNEVELAIDTALGEGAAAAALARTVRQHLQNPEQIFRRFRYGLKDADGNPILDENGNPVYGKKWKRRVFDPDTGGFRWVDDNPKDYHPGRGVYRSSVKNAMRLARTEINMAYRESEFLRWQQLDFVVGFRVCLSNNHTCLDSKGKPQPFTDICDELAGDYPKTFKFVGWHPQCRCYVVPIMKDYDEYNEDRANRFKAIVRRQEYKSLPSRRTVRDVPQNFRDYIDSIADRAAGWKSQPFYIRDNFVGGVIAGGLKPAIPTRTLNQVQPCTDYDTEIAKRKEWAYAFGLDISRLDALRTAGNKAALRAELDRLNAEITPKLEDWVVATQELKSFIGSELKPFPELAKKYADGLAANSMSQKNYYADSIAKLKQLLTEAQADAAKAATSSYSPKMPEIFKAEGDFCSRYGATEYERDFFDLLEAAPKVEFRHTNGGSYETDMGRTVRIDNDTRLKQSEWYRRGLIYHEFGHAIGDQRKIITLLSTSETDLIKLRNGQIKRLREKEKAVYYTRRKQITHKPDGTWETTVVRERHEVNQMKAKTISARLDILYSRIREKKEDDPIFTRLGIGKYDLIEQIAAVQDTLKSLITSVGWGHSTSYFKSDYHRQHEYLAHCFENRFAGNRVFQQYLPDIYAEMIAFVNTLKKP